MKYYLEENMKDVRLRFEKRILRWLEVSTKKMFGCPSYQANGKLFAFLVTNGIVITQLTPAEREKLSHQHETAFFAASDKTVQNWLRVPIKHARHLDQSMSFVRRSYENALRKP